MTISDSFFQILADAISSDRNLSITGQAIREDIANHLLAEWTSYLEIEDIISYTNYIRQPETPLDSYIIQAAADILELNINIHTNNYIITVGSANQNNFSIDLVFGNEDVFAIYPLSSIDDASRISLNQTVAEAITYDNSFLFRALLEIGIIHINDRNEEGDTWLHIAALRGAAEIVAVLGNDYIPSDATNFHGQTALDIAISQEHDITTHILTLYTQNNIFSQGITNLTATGDIPNSDSYGNSGIYPMSGLSID